MEAVFIFDWLSLIFLGFVFIVSSLVIFYRNNYMEGDYNYVRFYYLVLGFVFSIIIIIISPNILIIILG